MNIQEQNQKVNTRSGRDVAGPSGGVNGDAYGGIFCGQTVAAAFGSSFPAGGQVKAPAGADRLLRDAPAGADSWKPSRGQLVGEGFTELIKRYDSMWDWYVHLSFRPGRAKSGSIHPERADGLFMQFIDRLNKEIFGRNYKRHSDRGVLVARATEIGGIGGLLHYHGLIGRIPGRVRRLEWKEKWFLISGIGRIYEYDPKQGGAAYLSKSAYAWKRGEIDFIGPWHCVEKVMTESYRVPEIFAVGELQAIQ
jgi:hypothetical protein